MREQSGKCLLVSIAGLDLGEATARVRAGRLPVLASLIARGAIGALRSPYPADNVATVATLATGVAAGRHGMVMASVPWAGGMREAGHACWEAAPFWSRLADAGLDTASVGLPLIRPGAAWPGLHIDDRLAIAGGASWEDWPLPRDVAPPAIRALLRDARVHPEDVTDELLRPFLTEAVADDDRAGRQRLVELRAMLARLASVDAAAQMLLTEQPWDLAIVHHDWLALAAARFADAPAPFAHTVDQAWTLLDATVAGLARALPERATLLLVSAGGKAGAGAFLACGPGIAPGTQLGTVDAQDLAPTVLARFGLRDPALPGTARLGGEIVRDLPPAPERAAPVAADAADLARVAAFGFAPPVTPPLWHAQRHAVFAELTLASDPAEGERWAQAALDAGPDTLPMLGVLAAARVAREEPEGLAELADRAEALPGGSSWAMVVRAAAFALRGERVRAADQLRAVEAAETGKSDANLLTRAALVWMMIDRRHEAVRMLDRVLADHPARIDALLARAGALRDQPLAVEAALHRVLEIDPAHPVARAELVSLLRSLGRHAEADRAGNGVAQAATR